MADQHPSAIDQRTNRPVGDHGTAAQAIEFALDGHNHDHDPHNALAFLRAWNEDMAFEEWPEFYTWLNDQEAAQASPMR